MSMLFGLGRARVEHRGVDALLGIDEHRTRRKRKVIRAKETDPRHLAREPIGLLSGDAYGVTPVECTNARSEAGSES